MELLIGFPGIGGHNMIATEDVDDDLWIFVLLEFVDDGLYDAFFVSRHFRTVKLESEQIFIVF